jgi:uncharacterized protein (DUF736 family)
LGLRPVESANDKAPAFEIMVLNVAKRWVQIGALWEMTSNSSGEVFYQGKLDDPSISEPLQIMLFGNMEEGFRVVWNRPTARRENLDGSRQNKRKANADDGFGTGNATETGQLATDQTADDYVPAF